MVCLLGKSIFFQSNKFTIFKIKDEKKKWQIFHGIQFTEDYPSISRQEAFKDLLKLKLQPTRVFN